MSHFSFSINIFNEIKTTHETVQFDEDDDIFFFIQFAVIYCPCPVQMVAVVFDLAQQSIRMKAEQQTGHRNVFICDTQKCNIYKMSSTLVCEREKRREKERTASNVFGYMIACRRHSHTHTYIAF